MAKPPKVIGADLAMLNRLIERAMRTLTETVFPGDGVLAAVSGGSDSLGMLVLLAECRKRISFRLTAAVVDHGLREVAREIELVHRLGARLGIEVVCEKIPEHEAGPAATRGSIQAWARECRYALLSEAARKANARIVATGHTRDDQAETVLLRLLRGSGVTGISAIPRTREIKGGVRIIRPVLDIGRVELREILKHMDIPFADDPSNENSRFLRVRVRKELLPLMNALTPDIATRLAALAQDAAAVTSFLESDLFVQGDTFEPLRFASGIRVDRRHFLRMPKNMWAHLVRRALCLVQGNLRRIERIHLEPVEAHIAIGRSTERLPFPGNSAVYIDHGSLLVFPRPLPEKPEETALPVFIGAGLWKLVLPSLGATVKVRSATEAAVNGLVLRGRRPGDKLFGTDRKLKDIFIDQKVPRPYRDFVPLLAEGDQVISCPSGIPCRKPDITVEWCFEASAPILDITS
jgi:tRNA(Ile)-lysidine synthase